MPASRFSLFLAIALTLVLAGALHAQPRLQEFSSRYYSVHTNAKPQDIRPHAAHMDEVFAAFRKRFGRVFRNKGRAQPTLYLLDERQDYIATLGTFGIDATHSGGMFFSRGGDSGLATWVAGQDPDSLWRTLQHEAFHQFAHQYIGPTLPLWANEGLAEYFGDALLVNGKLKLGIVNQRRLRFVRAAIDAGTSMPLSDLINITSPQWHANMSDPTRSQLQYAQSWSLVYFLVHGDPRYRSAFETYLNALGRGFDHNQAYARGFGNAPTQAMEKRWREFIAELEPDPFSEAVNNLEFLARGIRWLDQQGEPLPQTFEELKQALQARKFTVSGSGGHGVKFVLQATDDGLFTYVGKDKQPTPFEMKANPKEGLPPILGAPMLTPTPLLAWSRSDGKLMFQVEYE